MCNELMVEAAKKTIDMWNWIAENPTVPPGFDSPLVEIANEGISPKLVYFDKHRHLEVPEISLCYLCEAAEEIADDIDDTYCIYCPLFIYSMDRNSTCYTPGEPYQMWRDLTIKYQSVYALAIVKMAEKYLIDNS